MPENPPEIDEKASDRALDKVFQSLPKSKRDKPSNAESRTPKS